MVENFLRPPQGLLGVLADVLRALGVLGVVLAVMLFDLTDAGILAFALMGVFAPRFIGLRPAADVLTSVSLLIAAWSNVLDVYTAVPGGMFRCTSSAQPSWPPGRMSSWCSEMFSRGRACPAEQPAWR